MNLKDKFDKEKYQELLKYLDSIKDLKYLEFQKKIVVCDNVIGVRTNELKKIAKEISKGDYDSFIENNTSNLYELILIEGFIYGYLKIPFNDLIKYLDKYLLKLNSWGQVDLVVSNLKIFKKDQKLGFPYAKNLTRNKNRFIKRFGIIILLNYYLHDEYIDKVLDLVSKIKSDDYYVKMAMSWLMSISYIKYKEKTLVYLVNIKDEFVYNQALNKIVDSRRISDDEKKFIKNLKRVKEKN
ncbi:MAG: DNA alkylation repair protein [Bacilli bacterium]|nr:DNA alkylation repair protein [Bacilli bacterium]